MATIEIRKKSASVWIHTPSDFSQFIQSKFRCKIVGEYFQVVEYGGRQLSEYHYSDVTVYDDTQGGSAETFSSGEELMLRLESLEYPAFFQGSGGGGIGFQPIVVNPENGQTLIYSNGQWVNGYLDTNGNRFINTLPVTIEDDEVTVPEGFSWVINTNNYFNSADIHFAVESATAGFYRTDIIVAQASNTTPFIYIKGEESESTAVPPNVPDNTLLVTHIYVFGDQIGEPTPPIDGSLYISKESEVWVNFVLTGLGGLPTLVAINENQRFINITGNPSGTSSLGGYHNAGGSIPTSIFWPGMTVKVHNATASDQVIKHNYSSAAIKFLFPKEEDYIIKPNETVTFTYRGGALEFEGIYLTAENISFDFTVTKSELDNLIANGELIPNALYEITGVNPELYGGTTIYLRAISTTELNPRGVGKFYNPKYDKGVQGFGIVKDYVWWENSANQKESGVYAVDDVVIWGGKHWVCIQETDITTKYIIDDFELDTDYFQVIPYNDTDYNVAYDEIVYDYNNDWIIERNEQNSNIVSFSYDWLVFFSNDWLSGDIIYDNPIRGFQWGNVFDYDSYTGIGFQKITNSLNRNVNFRGSYQSNLTFDNNSYQNNLTFDNNSYQNNLTFDNDSYQSNLTFDNNSYQNNLTFDNSSYINYLSGSGLSQRDIFYNNYRINYDTSSSKSHQIFSSLLYDTNQSIISSLEYASVLVKGTFANYTSNSVTTNSTPIEIEFQVRENLSFTKSQIILNAQRNTTGATTGRVFVNGVEVGTFPLTTTNTSITITLSSSITFSGYNKIRIEFEGGTGGTTTVSSLRFNSSPTIVSGDLNLTGVKRDGYILSAKRPIDYIKGISGDTEVNFTYSELNIPTKTSDLINDSGFITSSSLTAINLFIQHTESTVSGDDGSNLIQPDLGLPILEVDDLQENSSYSGELVLNIQNNNIPTAKVIELFGAEVYNNTNPSADITTKISFTLDFFNQDGNNIDYKLSWEYLSSGEVLFGEHVGTIDNTSNVDFELLVTGHSTDSFNLKKARLWRN